MIGTYDVRIWAIRVRKGRPKPYQVRWKAGTAVFARSFGTRGRQLPVRTDSGHSAR